jgi:uncharacterized ferritin-like protein (DUF455 family)
MRETGDIDSADVLKVIYEDEKAMSRSAPSGSAFSAPARRRTRRRPSSSSCGQFRGALKAPFNDVARAEAGLTPSFYRSLTSTSS